MDINDLKITLIRGYEGSILEDGRTQKDKILPYFSIVYPYEGDHEVAIEDGPLLRIRHESDCFLVPPQVRHTIVHRILPGEKAMRPRWMFLTVLYRDTWDVTAWFRPPLRLSGEDALPFRNAIDELLGNPSPFAQLRIAGTVLEQLIRVSEFLPAEPLPDSLYPAMEAMGDRLEQNLTVEELAKCCGMSPASFHRCFRSAVGMPPMQYLNQQRLKLAAQLLLSGRDTLAGIADRCGFCDEFHLSRNFKAFYGVSPREFRKRTEL